MSVRVNLLPQVSRDKGRATQQRAAAAAVVVAIAVVLAALSLVQRGELRDAEEALAAAEQARAAAQTRVGGLDEYAELEAGVEAIEATLRDVMGDQTTLAGVLQDLALFLPEEVGLFAVSVNLENVVEDDDGVALSAGVVNLSGEVLHSHAPGVERLLMALERAAGFRDVTLQSSVVDDEQIASVSIDLRLGLEFRTERYADGIPEGLR